MLRLSVIIAPVYTGKTHLMAGAPWRHTRRGRRVMDSDVMVQPVHTLYKTYGVPEANWTATQWAAWHGARSERLETAARVKKDDSLIILVHDETVLPRAHVLCAVMLPESVFRQRAHVHASKRDLALLNRKTVTAYVRTHADVPVFSSLVHAMEAF